jgi:hypothetical protein
MADRVRLKPKASKLANKPNVVNLFLDSGAYSAWSKGEDIKIEDYIEFVRDHEELIWHYVNLDVIPGKFGHRQTGAGSQGEIERSADGSYKNQQIMRDAGLSPIPVFHQGERMYWLERYLKDGEKYIGLSANKFVRPNEQQRWLDQCFNLLCDKEGRPFVKTHGFALTSFPMMTKYPWYTVDSTTWSLTPGYGQLIIPAYIDGKPDYLHPPMRVAISGVTHKSSSSQKKQFENLGEVAQAAVEHFILEECKIKTIGDARYSTQDRRRALLVYYRNLCEQIRDVRHTALRASVWGKDHFDTSHLKPLKPFNLHLCCATSLNREWADLMTELGTNHRLLSYWELRHRDRATIELYVKTGNHGIYKKSAIRQDWSETYLNRRRLGHIVRMAKYAAEEAQFKLEEEENEKD